MLVKLYYGLFLSFVALAIRSLTVYLIIGHLMDLIPGCDQHIRIGATVFIIAIAATKSSKSTKIFNPNSSTYMLDVSECFGEVIGACLSAIVTTYLLKALFLYFVG